MVRETRSCASTTSPCSRRSARSDRRGSKIDFIPTVFGKRLWIIEAKRPQGGEDLFSDAHLGQAWSYATDPRIDVPFIVLCDGTRLGVFDLSGPEWTKPVFDGPKAELPERFGELEELLGARRIAEWIGRRQLRHLRSALEAQIDLDALEQAQAEVEAMVTELRPVVQGRREEIREEARRRVRERGGEALDRAGIWGHAQHLNGPLIPSKGDVGRAVELVRRQPAALRIREFANFRQSSIPAGEEQPRMWFTLRLVELGAAVWLVEDEACGGYCRELAEAAAASHASGLAEDPLQAAAYRLQRALGPLGWRLAILAKPTLDEGAKALAERLEPEEWLRRDGELGLGAYDAFKRAAILGPRMAMAQITPWEVETLSARAAEAEAVLEQLPKPGGYEELQPIGDPWLASWQEGDPLSSYSEAILKEISSSDGTPAAVGELAGKLLAAHYS